VSASTRASSAPGCTRSPRLAALPAEWKVTIDEKQAAGAIDIARRVTATRGDVVVKLVIDEYRALEE
jgi:hypothetical protein